MNTYVFYVKIDNMETTITVYTHTLNLAIREVEKQLPHHGKIIDTAIYPMNHVH